MLVYNRVTCVMVDNNPKNYSDRSKEEDFFSLFLLNQKKIYAFILSLVPNCADSEDILQETTLIMWRKFTDFKPGTSFSSWGFKIAYFNILNFRTKNRNSRVMYNDDVFRQFLEVSSRSMKAYDENTDALNACIQKLGERDKQMIKLRYEDAVSVMGIAGMANVSVSRIYRSLARITRMLARCISKSLA